MKAKTYRFIFSALLICLAAVGKAQTIDGKLYTPFNNYYQWIGGKFNSNLNIPKVAATNGRDTGGIRYSLIDSSMYVWTGSQWRAVGSSLDTTSLSNRIEARVKYSDTAAMLANYLDYVPTLQQVTTAGNSTTDTIKINNSNNTFTSLKIFNDAYTGGTSGRGAIELYSSGRNTKLRLDEEGIRFISNISSQSLLKFVGSGAYVVNLPDSSGILTQRVKVNGTTYNTAANGVVDLGTIQSDTSSLSNRINERVKYTDTAAMLAPYLRNIPSLHQVTNVGNATTDSLNIKTPLNKTAVSISSQDFAGAENTSGEIILRNTFDNSNIKINDAGFEKYTSLTSLAKQVRFNSNRDQYSQINFPDSSGTLVQRITLNGQTYNSFSNGVVDLPNTDTATVVKAYVTNAEAVTITKGQVVYIFGAQGDRAAVKLAKNTSDTFSSKTLGIVRDDIAAGQAGWVTTQGQVSGINLGAYTAGDILWLDSVAGGFTKTKPVAPYHSVFVGVVERANAGNGLIYVKPQNGVELDEIHNVLITSPTNNQVLSYTASTGIWENKTVSASIFAYTARTTTYTAGAEDYVIHCTSGTFSVNLPTAVGITGKVYIIKNSGSGLITIDPNGSETIDGVTTYTMGQAESVQVISTGSNWITL